VDTTYIEECQDIVTQHCQETHQQVHHSSAVVGHDSQVIHGGHGYHKRDAEADAEAEPGYGHSSGPHCQQHVEKQCHKVPQQHERKVPRPVCKTIVDTTYIEECVEEFVTECQESHTQVHHSSAVVGHDTQVIHGGHGHGYHKREAEPGYGHQPHHNNLQCFSKPYKQCHQKPIQNQRQECHEEYDVIVDTTYIEECQDIVTQHCQETHQQVHHSSAVVGHDSQVISHGSGYHKRDADAEAEPGYGHSSGPHCQQNVEKQCHKVPQQHERKVPRPVCKTIVDTTYIEECVEEFVTECQESHTQVHHSSAVVGHDTQVISHGHGYH